MAGADPENANGGRCDEVLRDVWLFLDDEMDPENRAAVQRHLDDCSPCLAEAGIDYLTKRGAKDGKLDKALQEYALVLFSLNEFIYVD